MWCLTKCGRGSSSDFNTCSNFLHPVEESDQRYKKVTYDDILGKQKVVQMVRTDHLRIYAISVLVLGTKVRHRRVFSRPVFYVGKFSEPLQELNWHHLLLDLKAHPRVWNFLQEGYPGREVIWTPHYGGRTDNLASTSLLGSVINMGHPAWVGSRGSEPTSMGDRQSVISSDINLAGEVGFQTPRGMDGTTSAPGLASLLKEHHSATLSVDRKGPYSEGGVGHCALPPPPPRRDQPSIQPRKFFHGNPPIMRESPELEVTIRVSV